MFKRKHIALFSIVLLGVLPLSLLVWSVCSQAGLVWLLSCAGVQSQGVVGNVLSGFRAERLYWQQTDLQLEIRQFDSRWQWAWPLQVEQLKAAEVSLWLLSEQQSSAPQQLTTPFAWSIKQLEFDSLRVYSALGGDAQLALQHIHASLISDGKQHRLERLAVDSAYGQMQANVELSGIAPFALSGTTTLSGVALPGGGQAVLQGKWSGDLHRLRLDVTGSGAGMQAQAQLFLDAFANMPLQQLQLHTSNLNPQHFADTAPRALLAIDADLRTQGQQLLGQVQLSNTQTAPLDQNGLPIRQARAQVELSLQQLVFNELLLELPSEKGGGGHGSIRGQLRWQPQQWRGQADLTIQQINPAVLHSRLRPMSLNGYAKLSGGEQQQRAQLQLTDGRLQLQATVLHQDQLLELQQLLLTRQQARLIGQGKLWLNAQKTLQFQGELQHFDLAQLLQVPVTDLNANLQLSGNLAPQLTGQLRFELQPSRIAQYPLAGNGQLELASIQQAKGQVALYVADNQLQAQGSWGHGQDHVQLNLQAPHLEQLWSGLAGQAQLVASIQRQQGGRLQGTWQGQTQQLAWQQHSVHDVQLSGELQGEQIQAQIQAKQYRHRELIVPGVQFALQGTRSEHTLTGHVQWQQNQQLQLRAQGGLDAQWGWQGWLQQLQSNIVLPVTLSAPVQLSASNRSIELGTARLQLAGGEVALQSLSWTPQRWRSAGRFSDIGLRLLNASQLDTLRIHGDWQLEQAQYLDGLLNVQRSSGDILVPADPALPLGLQDLRLSTRIKQNVMSASLQARGTRLGEVAAQLQLPVDSKNMRIAELAPLVGKVELNMADLSWIAPLLHNNLSTGGHLQLQADIAGSYAAPKLSGLVRGEQLAIALLEQGVRLQDGQLQARFDQHALQLEKLSFSSPNNFKPKDSLLRDVALPDKPGKLVATGSLGLSGEQGSITIQAEALPILQRPDRWLIVSGEGEANLLQRGLQMTGKVKVDAGLIAQQQNDRPRLADDIVLTGQNQPTRKPFNVQVQASLDLGEHCYLRASGLESRLAGKLDIKGTAQQLRAHGTISTQDANFAAYGQRLTVERGIVNFQGALHDPGLNVLAVRKGLPVEAGVEVSGTVLRPLVRLVSTPNVPDAEKLSWIVLGRVPDTTGLDGALLAAAAGSILGGSTGGFTNQLKQALGIDELNFRQAEEKSNNDNPLASQIVTIGKRLSSRLFVSYEHGVNAVTGVTKLTYNLTPNINIVTQAGTDNAIDVFYTFKFD